MPNYDSIFDRHPGPYLLCATFIGKKGRIISKWLKKADSSGHIEWTNDAGTHLDHDRDDVVEECRGWIQATVEPAIAVGVFSSREQQFCLVLHRRDFQERP